MKRTVGIIILIISIAAIAAGVFRKELRPLYINARAICYSCIGLQ